MKKEEEKEKKEEEKDVEDEVHDDADDGGEEGEEEEQEEPDEEIGPKLKEQLRLRPGHNAAMTLTLLVRKKSADPLCDAKKTDMHPQACMR